jgi:hypothetical protein
LITCTPIMPPAQGKKQGKKGTNHVQRKKGTDHV